MFRNRKILSIFLSLMLIIGMVIGGTSSEVFAEGSTTITILHVNDVHGRLEPDEREGAMGFGVFKAKLDELREENPNLLLLNAGDALHGTTMVNLTDGEAMITMMNAVGFDALVPGNHDFNYGYDRLLELKELAEFPVIAANVVKEADGESDFDAYVIEEVDGVRVGIFGLATEETKFKSHPDNTVGITFVNPVEAAKEAVKALQDEGVDVVIALVHLGIEGTVDTTSKEVAENVEGIDLIIDGHSHEELNLTFGDALLVQAGSYLKNIGVVELEVSEGKVVNKDASLIPTADLAEVEPDKEIVAMVEKINEANKPILDVVVGKAKVELFGGREEGNSVRANETILGNLIADVMRESTGADIAFANGGGIRATIPEGEVKVDDIIKAFPFTNTIASIEITGQELMDALEHGVELYPEEAGWFPQISGMSMKFDPNKEKGSRVLEVVVGGKPFDINEKYILATNDFMASGGDDYTMFANKPFVAEGGLLSDVLIEHFKEVGEVTAELENRIVNLPVIEETAEEYVVELNDVLWKIAEKFGTTWEKLAEYNNLKNPHLIFPEQVILIP
ncbi:MAG: 5'-nucleotidase C-terminal domain-containing protein [Tissierellaceae bacterium]|nr:5'-nucleotidase C-terminal domain-containing protein [Tissierellaceae bacterium]